MARNNPVLLTGPTRGLDGRSVLAKARAPLITDGRIGDFWIDTVSKKLYGPKNAAEWPDNGLIKGDKGWTPVFATVIDGTRRVQQIVDWTGGEGTKPAVGQYVGADGMVDDIEDAVDFRGPEGPQALINALDAKTDAVTYETLTALAEGSSDNEKAALKRVFEAGGAMPFRATAEAQTTSVPAAVNRAVVDGVDYIRVAEEPSHAGKFRSADRWTDDGAHDSANGGWWAEDPAGAVRPSQQAALTLASFGLGEGNAAFQAAMNTGGVVDVPSGEYSPGAVTPGPSPSFFRMGAATYPGGAVPLNLGTALTEQLFEGRLLYKKSASNPNDGAMLEVQRVVSHDDGAEGYVVPNVSVTTTIMGNAQDYQWPLLSRVWNHGSDDPNHTAIYGQNWRLHADAVTGFSGVFETADKTNQANPTSGSASIEVDFFANGSDGNGRRVGIHLVTGKALPEGDLSEMGVGVWLTQAHNDPTEGRFKRAIAVDADCDVAFDASNATFSSGGAAFRMAGGQYFSLTATNDRKLLYDDGYIKFVEGASERWRVGDESTGGAMNNNGPIQINYNQVLTSRQTGWNPMTGTANNSTAYATSTITLAQLAGRVMALQAVLTTHGLIGA